MVKIIYDKYIDLMFETKSEESEWFGYYNYDVLNYNQSRMLCNKAKFDGRSITESDTIDLGWYDLSTNEWHYIANSDSFNWQQGAMLQWLPGKGNENKVIYNYSDKCKYKSKIVDVDKNESNEFDFPIYCITPSGEYGITLNYERSYWCRAYHYQPIKNKKYDVQIADDDGIFRLDLKHNKVDRIVSIHDVIKIDSDKDFKIAKHWFEHIMLNPSGTKFAFLHRYTYGEGYGTRICIADIDGKNLKIVEGWRTKEWSHLGWKDDTTFAIYTVTKTALQAAYNKQMQMDDSRRNIQTIIKPMLRKLAPEFIKRRLRHNDKRYEVYSLKNDKYELIDLYEGDLLDIDGHPSFTKDGKYMITDSYPDKEGNQRLLIMNCNNKRKVLLAKLGAPLSGNPASCDLHPKLCSNNDYVVVDSAYSGKHCMMLFKINWEAVKKEIG